MKLEEIKTRSFFVLFETKYFRNKTGDFFRLTEDGNILRSCSKEQIIKLLEQETTKTERQV